VKTLTIDYPDDLLIKKELKLLAAVKLYELEVVGWVSFLNYNSGNYKKLNHRLEAQDNFLLFHIPSFYQIQRHF